VISHTDSILFVLWRFLLPVRSARWSASSVGRDW